MLNSQTANLFKKISIPPIVRGVGEYSFECNYLKQISFDTDSNLEKIGNYAFNNCSKISKIKEIGEHCISTSS